MLMQSKSSSTSPKATFNPRRFLFLAALRMTIGAFVGFIVAGANGVAPDSWIPFVVIGFIAASFLFPGMFVASISRNLKPMLQSAQGGIANRILESAGGGSSPDRRVLARVGKLEEAGLTVSNFNHMFIFTLTVFPDHGAPYGTVIRQFITMGELHNFYT